MPDEELARIEEGDSAVGEKYDAAARSAGDGRAWSGSCVRRLNCGGGAGTIGKRAGARLLIVVTLSPVGGLSRRLALDAFRLMEDGGGVEFGPAAPLTKVASSSSSTSSSCL